MMKIPHSYYFLPSHQCVQVGLIGKVIAMTGRFTSEATIEAIIESVITHSLAGRRDRVLDIGQRHFPEGEGNFNSMAMFQDELATLSRDLTALLFDLQTMEESLRLTDTASRRRRRVLFGRPLGARNLEGVWRSTRSLEEEERRRQRLEVGLERSRQRRLHRYDS